MNTGLSNIKLRIFPVDVGCFVKALLFSWSQIHFKYLSVQSYDFDLMKDIPETRHAH